MIRSSRRLCCLVGLLLVCLSGALRADAADRQATGLQARHHAGQTFLTWNEVDPPLVKDLVSMPELRKIWRETQRLKKVCYRIYRSDRPIASVENLDRLAEAPPMTCWNLDHYGIDDRPEQKALRITPRRCRQFKLKPDQPVKWTNRLAGGEVVQSGEARADRWGLVTLEKVRLGKADHRIRIASRQ